VGAVEVNGYTIEPDAQLTRVDFAGENLFWVSAMLRTKARSQPTSR
jgi:hypothetical protein